MKYFKIYKTLTRQALRTASLPTQVRPQSDEELERSWAGQAASAGFYLVEITDPGLVSGFAKLLERENVS